MGASKPAAGEVVAVEVSVLVGVFLRKMAMVVS